MAASAAYTAAAAAAEADYLSLLKEDRTTGFPVFSVQADEGEHAVQIMESTDYILGDGSHHFEDLEHLRQFCTRCAIWDWTSSDLMAGKVPPSEKIAAIVRNMPLMQQMVRTCPPMALKMLLLFLGAVMQRPLEADLLEASQMHMKFNAVKGWLLSQVLPDEKPEDILAGWNLDASEAAVFEGYKRLWTAIYNQESAENQKEGDSEVESQNLVAQALEENRLGRQRPPPAEYFYRFCPSARNAEHISALQAWEEHAGGSLPSSPGRQRFAASVEAPVPVGMKLIGNSLSVYWQARGIAAMAGSAFASSSGQGFGGSFTDFLPRATPAGDAWGNASEELRRSCEACPTEQDWRWPHTCLGAWTRRPVLQALRGDMHRALRRSGAEEAAREILRPHDAVIHFRCFPFFNSQYPLAAFSLYEELPPSLAAAPSLRFVIIAGALGAPCAAAAAALERFLRRRYPQAEVLRRFNTSAPKGVLSEDLAGKQGAEAAAEVDFALQVFAPVLFRTPSSFSLWAALAREEGQPVLSAKNPPLMQAFGWRWQEADFGRNWCWVQAPLLTGDIVDRHGFDFEDHEPWVRWLEMH